MAVANTAKFIWNTNLSVTRLLESSDSFGRNTHQQFSTKLLRSVNNIFITIIITLKLINVSKHSNSYTKFLNLNVPRKLCAVLRMFSLYLLNYSESLLSALRIVAILSASRRSFRVICDVRIKQYTIPLSNFEPCDDFLNLNSVHYQYVLCKLFVGDN